MFLGSVEMKIEVKSTELEYWESVTTSGRKVSAEEVENPTCIG